MTAAAALAFALGKKRLATATARVCLWRGILVVIEADDGRPQILITRWALTRVFADMDELERWLDTVTGAKR